jgi:hypothetical protein
MPGSGKKEGRNGTARIRGGAGELDGDAFFRQSQQREKWMSRSDMEILRSPTKSEKYERHGYEYTL